MKDVEVTISRIMLVSPEQNELLRRNNSRIYIWPEGETAIDAMIFQGCRPMDMFIPAAERAIDLAGLVSSDGAIGISDSHRLFGGLFTKHLVTNEWLKLPKDGDENTLVCYDMVVEVTITGEELPSPQIETTSISSPSENKMENPLIMKVGVESFEEGYYAESNTIAGTVREAWADHKQEQEQAPGGTREEPQQAQPQPQPIPAPQPEPVGRRAQDGDTPSGRMAGRPGRVRNPLLDGRLKHVREARQKAAQASH